MIPYDDLVTALSSWRARQGLPVSTLGGTGSGPTATKSGSGPTKAPPGPPPGSSHPGMAAQSHDEEVSAEMLDEGAYEEGGELAAYGGEHHEAEATSIGGAPERPTEADLGNNREDW